MCRVVFLLNQFFFWTLSLSGAYQCKMRSGYLRVADADEKLRREKNTDKKHLYNVI